MKRVFLALATLCFGLTAIHAGDYSYLTFELTDGTKASVSISQLSLTVNGTTLTAGSQSFTLTNLAKMYFSATDESSTTGISSIHIIGNDDITDIYDLQGHKVTKDQMKKGVYIVKTKDRTYKIAVK